LGKKVEFNSTNTKFSYFDFKILIWLIRKYTYVSENSEDGVSSMSNVGVEDLAKILKFCSNSLENLVLVGVETCRIDNLHLEGAC
jgi:hypothetical protein